MTSLSLVFLAVSSISLMDTHFPPFHSVWVSSGDLED